MAEINAIGVVMAVTHESCPYFILCELQNGTQQCDATKREMSNCDGLAWYIRDGVKTDKEAGRGQI